ncbi:hypothetical protein SDC9_80217 [bioreactor metagenome]|uniref:HIRAN domain-containing protein n=1 Tax=bioreactor metagenome TaxID=1076179 RepID=A0A644YYF1_9ZZZZ
MTLFYILLVILVIFTISAGKKKSYQKQRDSSKYEDSFQISIPSPNPEFCSINEYQEYLNTYPLEVIIQVYKQLKTQYKWRPEILDLLNKRMMFIVPEVNEIEFSIKGINKIGIAKPGFYTGQIVAEPSNIYDVNAICVEIDGQTIGYLPANNNYLQNILLKERSGRDFVEVKIIIKNDYVENRTYLYGTTRLGAGLSKYINKYNCNIITR